MGSQPFLVHTVAMKAAADLIVNPSSTHAFQSSLDKAERRAVILAHNLIQQKEQNGFCGNFGAPASPPDCDPRAAGGLLTHCPRCLAGGSPRLALT